MRFKNKSYLRSYCDVSEEKLDAKLPVNQTDDRASVWRGILDLHRMTISFFNVFVSFYPCSAQISNLVHFSAVYLPCLARQLSPLVSDQTHETRGKNPDVELLLAGRQRGKNPPQLLVSTQRHF